MGDECGMFPLLTCLAEKTGEVGLSIGKFEGKRCTHTHDSIYLNIFISIYVKWTSRIRFSRSSQLKF